MDLTSLAWRNWKKVFATLCSQVIAMPRCANLHGHSAYFPPTGFPPCQKIPLDSETKRHRPWKQIQLPDIHHHPGQSCLLLWKGLVSVFCISILQLKANADWNWSVAPGRKQLLVKTMGLSWQSMTRKIQDVCQETIIEKIIFILKYIWEYCRKLWFFSWIFWYSRNIQREAGKKSHTERNR